MINVPILWDKKAVFENFEFFFHNTLYWRRSKVGILRGFLSSVHQMKNLVQIPLTFSLCGMVSLLKGISFSCCLLNFSLQTELPRIRPRPHETVFVCKRIFSLRFGLQSTRIRWKRSPKTDLFKNALQGGDFWKRRLFVYVWTDKNGGFQKRFENAT